MKIKWGATLKNGLNFCWYPKRWLPFFVLDFLIIFGIFTFIYYNITSLIYISAALTTQDISLLLSYLPLFLSIIILLILWFFLRLWITGAVIHQSYKAKEFRNSYNIAYKKYLSLIGVALVISILNYLFGLIPWVGFILTILITLIFFFAFQGVIIKSSGFYEALINSWKIFKNNILRVFIMWLLIAIISLLIISIFSIPIVALFLFILANVSIESPLLSFLLSIQSNLPFLIITGIIFLIGTAISNVFSLKTQTEFYLQIVKKRFKLF